MNQEGVKMVCKGELHRLYRSPVIVRTMNSRRLQWAGLLAGIEETRMHTELFEERGKGTCYKATT
jgi:hypothetical protein